VGYVRGLDPEVISYGEYDDDDDDDDEDQSVRPEKLLNHEYRDELSLDNWVYDGSLTDDIPNHGDIELPIKDLYAFC
jgi:hypothetical protein